MRARTCLCGLLLALAAAGAQADRLVFGSFRSADNAANWAHKLSATFAQEMQVQRVEQNGVFVHRVASAELDGDAYEQLSRRARAAGIKFWRLRAPPPDQSIAAAADPETGTPVEVRTPPPLGAPRLTPPSPVTEQPQESTLLDSPYAKPRALSLSRTEWDVGIQTRGFADEGDFGQDQLEGSLSVQLDYYRGWDNDRQSITFAPFVRLDSADDERTHADLREFFYSRVSDSWDLHVGARRVFWGVTEFHHLIDIVNQTDLVENLDTEDKLGQPMVQLSLVRDWGILDMFALVGFRERTFPGTDGRTRLPFRVLDDDAVYESGAEDKRVDAAVRWSHYLGPFEVGLHHFWGTSRDPILQPLTNGAGDIVLQPFYPVIDQTGIDAQAFYGEWAFKLEGFTRSGYGDRYTAANVGFERTLVGVFGSRADLGLLAEYMFDDRDDGAFNTLFEDDIALGARLALNDFADTQALLGLIFDAQTDEYLVSLEASRRLSDSWLFSVEGRVFGGGERLRSNIPPEVLLNDPDFKSAFLQQDDYLQLEFTKFF